MSPRREEEEEEEVEGRLGQDFDTRNVLFIHTKTSSMHGGVSTFF